MTDAKSQLARTATLAVVVAALAAAGGFLVYRSVSRPTTVYPAAPSPPGSPESPAPRPAAAAVPTPPQRRIPEHVPEVKLAGLDGKPRALADFHDKVLVINFWATWCVPCRREIPLLRQLRRERHAQGVEIVGIAVDFADSVQKYVRDIGLDYPLMIGEEDGLAAAESFGMDLVLPFTVFADAERRIVAVKVGELHADEARLILGAVQQINAKTVDIVAAKADIAAKMRELAAERALAAAATPKS